MRDGGCFDAVGCVEFAEDVRDVDAGRFDADHERGGDLAVGIAPRDEPQDLGLSRSQAEGVRQAWLSVGGRRVGRIEIEPCALCEQLDLLQQGSCSHSSRDGMGFAEWQARFGAGCAGGHERFGLAPAAVGGERRSFELFPGRYRLCPRLRSSLTARAKVLGLR